MGYVDWGNRAVYPGSAENGERGVAPVIYVIDAPEHPVEPSVLSEQRQSTVIALPVHDWNDSLTPWPAPRIYRESEDFGGNAAMTLDELLRVIPAIEQAEHLAPRSRAICGYSLAGLFALYAFVSSGEFSACACLSGSVWYKGWVDHLRALDFDAKGRFAYFTVGNKERKSRNRVFRTVEDDMAACADIVRANGGTADFLVGNGDHLHHIPERYSAGLHALDSFLAR